MLRYWQTGCDQDTWVTGKDLLPSRLSYQKSQHSEAGARWPVWLRKLTKRWMEGHCGTGKKARENTAA